MEYSEKQKLKSRFILFAFVFSVLISVGISITMWQIKDSGQNIYSLIWVPFIIAGVIALSYYLVFHSELETAVRNEGFTYRYSPFIRTPRLISYNDIVSWRIDSKKNLPMLATAGYKRSLVHKRTSIILDGDTYLEIKANKGKTFLFSTTNHRDLSNALRNYISPKEIRSSING